MNRGFQRGCARELGLVPARPSSVQGPIPRMGSVAYDAGVMVELMLAIACWWTGRGLRAGSEGAREVAGILLLLPLLASLVLALSLPSPIRLVLLGVTGVCVFGLHAVWTGYAPGASPGGFP